MDKEKDMDKELWAIGYDTGYAAGMAAGMAVGMQEQEADNPTNRYLYYKAGCCRSCKFRATCFKECNSL